MRSLQWYKRGAAYSDRKSPLHLCLRVPVGEFIDNSSVINYDQLYAQMMYELHDKFEYV